MIFLDSQKKLQRAGDIYPRLRVRNSLAHKAEETLQAREEHLPEHRQERQMVLANGQETIRFSKGCRRPHVTPWFFGDPGKMGDPEECHSLDRVPSTVFKGQYSHVGLKDHFLPVVALAVVCTTLSYLETLCTLSHFTPHSTDEESECQRD